MLLAADAQRPQRLEIAGPGVPDTRFTYARGALVLWSRHAEDCLGVLQRDDGGLVAIANPATAPYGAAARDFLQAEGLWESLHDRIVVGENIAQTLQFAASGNAQVGVIARSQLQVPSLPPATCTWPVPAELHQPIDQQAVLLQRGANNRGATAFLQFLQGDAGRDIIRRHGYELPEVTR